MNLSFEYHVGIWEYHTAVYFGMTSRYVKILRIFVVITAVALVCHFGAMFGVIPAFALPSYLFLGYLVWLLASLIRWSMGC